jgi:D-sedoheptulose 7-phosphate isomerase
MLDKPLKEHFDCFGHLPELDGVITQIGHRMISSIENGGKILICGNGGSAADSQHFSAELVGRFYKDRDALPAIALTTDTSIITAVANDYGCNRIFSRQVEALGHPGDMLLGLSTSGNSENIIQAVLAARKKQMQTIALTGADGGKLKDLVDWSINIPCRQTPRIQEAHGFILHVWAEQIEAILCMREESSC